MGDVNTSDETDEKAFGNVVFFDLLDAKREVTRKEIIEDGVRSADRNVLGCR